MTILLESQLKLCIDTHKKNISYNLELEYKLLFCMPNLDPDNTKTDNYLLTYSKVEKLVSSYEASCMVS